MNPIIVAGSPRSGTSVVAGILHHLGVDMGKYYVKPDVRNPTGYWEDAQLVFNDMKFYEENNREWELRFIDLVKDRKAPWGFKTPTICATIADVKDILEKMEYTPVFLYVKRNKQDNIQAIWEHHGIPNAREQYEAQQANLRTHLPVKSTFCVELESLTENPKDTIAEIIEVFNIKAEPRAITKAVLSVLQESPKKIEAVPSSLYR